MKLPSISVDYVFMDKADEKASRNPLMAMVGERTNDKYARVVGQKGVGKDNDVDWLIKDMPLEPMPQGLPPEAVGTISSSRRAVRCPL